MPTTTSRLSLLQPLTGDSPAELRLADTSNTNTLDNAALFFPGTLANRGSVVTPLVSGVRYYASDTGLYYEYNGSVWQTLPLLAGPYGPLTIRAVTTNATAVAGQHISVGGSGSITVTTPAVVADVEFGVAFYGSGSCTITAASGGIFGLGVSNASSIPLSAIGATVRLKSDGTNWQIVTGQLDTGWVPLTLVTNIAAGLYVPAARWAADTLDISGTVQNNGSTIGSNFATLPSGIPHPAQTLGSSPVVNQSTNGIANFNIAPNGLLFIQNFNGGGGTVSLDGVGPFRLS